MKDGIIFTYNENKNELEEFSIQLPFIELKKPPWRQYIQQNNTMAGALLSKMGHIKSEKIQVKKEFLRILLGSHI